MSDAILDIIQTSGILITLLGLYFARQQIVAQRRQIETQRLALKATSEIVLKSTRLLYMAMRIFCEKPALDRADIEIIMKLWSSFLGTARSMYQDDPAWEILIKDVEEVVLHV